MWLADQWNDYEVIDCSKGEKLERWGDDEMKKAVAAGYWNLFSPRPAQYPDTK